MAWMSILMVLLSRGGGNDLLDYMPTDAYWRVKGVTVTVERMVAELATGEPGDSAQLVRDLGADDAKVREAAMQKLRAIGPAAVPALEKAARSDDPETSLRARELLRSMTGGAQAKAVRRLMALRALGELKEAEALPALRPLLESKDLFVADYARQAIAAIEGKPSARPRPTEADLWKDLCLLPARCGIVAQARPPAGGPVAFQKLLEDAEHMLPPGQDPGAALTEWTKMLLTVAERVGNVRLDGVTVGVAENLGDRSGFLVAVGRGLYDAEALKATLRQAGATSIQTDGIDVLTLQMGNHLAFIPCSNDRLVFAVGPAEEIPTKELVAVIRRGGDQPSLRPEMLALIKPVGHSAPAWGAARMTDAYRQMPVLVPFDTLTLTSRESKEGAIAFTLVGVGKDPAAVQAAADQVGKDVRKTAEAMRDFAAKMPVLKAPAEFLGSIAVKAEEGRATLTGTLRTPGVLMLPMMFHGLAEPEPRPVPKPPAGEF